MKMNKNGYMTTRSQYKAVKKYDHAQFDRFCRSIYEHGFTDGKEAVPGLDFEDVLKAIGLAKGVGPATMQNIKESLDKCFGEKGAQDGRKDED